MKHIRRSSLLYNFGQEVQMDTAFAIWYESNPMASHLALDKATEKVLCGWFDIQETTRKYYIMLMNVITKYGIPKKIKTNKRGTFSVNKFVPSPFLFVFSFRIISYFCYNYYK